MFFDERQKDTVYPQLLCDIAKKQQELLRCHFIWNQRRASLPKVGFLGRKQSEPIYEKHLQELEYLKAQTVKHRRNMGYGSGIFWWNIPWEKLERYLLFDLNEEADSGSWRFERKWELVPVKDALILMLREEGHCSSFSQESTYETGILSAYSTDEINSRMKSFNGMMNLFDLTDLASSGNAPVHSVLTGADYDSAADYLLSGEHYAVRSYFNEQKARSLYTETETTRVYATSNSRHYRAVFAVGQIQLGRGNTLNRLIVENYRICGCDGEVPDYVEKRYAEKDAAVGCAAFFADSSQITAVPLQLFGTNIRSEAVSFEDAMRQAEIYTCLAGKITCD